ncbi:hypothetical protein [Geobacter sp. FeAm09]|nr:hypothetical protein [Geobacter sp. FeAm09]
MQPSRISLYVAIGLIALLAGFYYLHCQTPADRNCPVNVIQLFTKARF